MTHATGEKFLKPGVMPTMWCAGCGIGGMLGALLRAFEELGYSRSDTVIVTGIGCTGKADDYLVTNALHTTHGRALAFATGIKAFKPGLNVVAVMGDGDATTIGGNHLIHAARRNIDVTAIVLNNLNYGMTGGQASGTTPEGAVTSTTAFGNPERDLDVCALAEVAGANYVARSTPSHGQDLKELMKQALTRKGFSLVEVIAPCPTHFGRYNQMKETPAMLNWIRQRAVPVEQFRLLAAADRRGKFPIGTLVERDEPDFTQRYEMVRRRALEIAGDG